MKQKITKKMPIGEALRIKPEAAEILFEAGMMCVGCVMAQQETIEQGCRAHGMNNKEIDELIKRLNKK